MAKNKTSMLRQLVPKSYHFDGYNEINCPNSRDKPFWSESTIEMGNHTLTISLKNADTLSLKFSSLCPGKIIFEPTEIDIHTFAMLLKKALKEDSDFITFEVKVNYIYKDLVCLHCEKENHDCQHILTARPQIIMAAVSFNPSDIKIALSHYYELTNKHDNGGSLMKNNKKNLFGMNFEFGMSKDPNISSTLMGVSVRNPENGNWYVFDQASGTRKNLANMKFGEFPVILLPAQVLNWGDLVKLDGKYYYVQEAVTNKSTGKIQSLRLIGAADGVIREIIPEESFIPGLNMYTKVMAFDIKSISDPNSKQGLGGNIMAAVCMMQWAKGKDGSEFSLDTINDNSFNGLGAYLPLLMATNGGNLSSVFNNTDGTPNMAMLMMLGSDNDSDEMMQMIVLSQLLGGQNPLSNIISPATPASPHASETNPANPVANNICSKCGTIYTDPEVIFCSTCGGKVVSKQLTCKKCNALLKGNAAFCHKCGSKIGPTTCIKCGKTLDDSDAFCSACGASQTETVIAPATQDVPSTCNCGCETKPEPDAT